MSDDTPLPTGYQLSALDPTYRETPWVPLDLLRSADPVHHDQQLNRYFFTRGQEVEALVKNRHLVVDPAKANDVPCFEGSDDDKALFLDGSGNFKQTTKPSACKTQHWEIEAGVTDDTSGAKTTQVQGISLRVQSTVKCL